jgi:signal transduction histidine kinase
VILNLFTNAFYAVGEKKRLQEGLSAVPPHAGLAKAGLPPENSAKAVYEPTVAVSTKKMGNKVEIRVKDNGMGIPQRVIDKIFLPFFTTKPAGQGTGLGLSISYDIIKSHRGEIKVDTKEGEFTEFIIILPL